MYDKYQELTAICETLDKEKNQATKEKEIIA